MLDLNSSGMQIDGLGTTIELRCEIIVRLSRPFALTTLRKFVDGQFWTSAAVSALPHQGHQFMYSTKCCDMLSAELL